MKKISSGLILGFLVLIISIVGLPNDVIASHVPGGNITYECVGPNQYLVTLTLFEDCGTAFETNADEFINVQNDCGYPAIGNTALQNIAFQQEVSQLCPAQIGQSECNGGNLPGIYMHQWQAVITLPGPCDSWTFSYSSCCRNTSTNVSGQPGYYWESILNDQTFPCNTSPEITAQPIPYVCVNQPVNYNLGASEPDGNTLVYSFIGAQSAAGTFVTYNGGYSAAVPIPGITIDPNTGQIDFTPTQVGNYIVAILIEEYDANGNLVGSIIHDIQFEVINCSNVNPSPPVGGITNYTGNGGLIGPDAVEVCEGDAFCFDVVFDDPDLANILTVTSNVTTVLPGATLTTTGTNPVTATVCWTAQPGSPTFNSFVLTVEDDGCPINGLATMPIEVHIINSTYAGANVTMCQGIPTQLNASGGTTFDWSVISGDPIVVGTNFSCNPCQDPIANPSVTTVYEVTSNLTGGCVNIDTITVTVVPDFTYTMGAVPASTCLFDSIPININMQTPGAFTYEWTPTTFLSDPNIPNPVAGIQTPGNYTYYVDITSPGGCVKTDSVSFTIQSAVSPVIDALATPDSVCGTPAQLDVWFDTTVTSAGVNDNFDGGFDPLMWTNVSNGQTGVAGCGTQTGTGDALYFDSSTGDRAAETVSFNASACTSIDFCLFIGNSSSTPAPCENADNGEDVLLEYSTDGGATWITMVTYQTGDWDPGGPYDNQWGCFSVPVPPGAQGPTTMFRWVQPQYSACTGCDNWSLDDVEIQCASQSTYSYTWTGTNVSDPSLQDPTAEPFIGSWYYVEVVDDSNACTAIDSVFIDACDPCPMPDITFSNVSCPNGNDGFITATATSTDGPPFTFLWTDDASGAVIQSTTTNNLSDTLFNVGEGAYTIQVTDTTGCARDTTINITDPPDFAVTHNDTLICIDGTAVLTALATGGNGGPYTQNWIGLGTGVQNVNPGTDTCYDVFITDLDGCNSDTTQMCVTLNPPLSSSLTAPVTAVCPGTSVDLEAAAASGNGGPYTITWLEDGTQIGTGTNITVDPMNPLTTYCAVISDGCETPDDTTCVDVEVFEVPQVSFTSDVVDGCFPVAVNFTNTTDPALTGDCFWDFGNGANSNDCNPSYIYENIGTYTVTLTVTSPNGCQSDTTAVDYINVYPYPVAAFDFSPDNGTILNPEVSFQNLSTGNTVNQWTFGEAGIVGTSTEVNPEVEFPNNNPGTYPVELYVENQYGCSDTAYSVVIIQGIFTFYVPNSFTPDGDGINDVFLPLGDGVDAEDYALFIFDRWGEVVFTTEDMNQGWDGRFRNQLAKQDVYVWKIKARDRFTGELKEFNGHVTLLR